MKHITTRDLQNFHPPMECRSRISLLDRLTGVTFSKLVWFDNEDGLARGSTLRHINVDNGIAALTAYLVAHQHNTHCQVKKSLSTNRELLNILKILRDK